MKILFTGGGTGGHIIPIIAIVRELQKIKEADLQLFYIGPKDEFNELLLEQEGIKVFSIFAGKIRRYLNFKSILQNLIDIIFKTPLGFFQAFWRIFFLAPDIIFSKGGYGAIPATLAGWVLKTPVFLHESDVVPGLSNIIASTFATKIFVSFPHTQHLPLQKVIEVGNPIRESILTGSTAEAKEIFKLTGEKPVILVLGGSQGSKRINDILLIILDEMLKLFEVIHQTGEKNFEQIKSEAKVAVKPEQEKYYHPVPFLKETELRHAYAASDFIVSRAGSGSVFEIAALGKPAILIPLPESAQGHQIQNAYVYANTGSAIVIEEANLTPHFFLEKLKYLFSNPGELERMKKSALSFAKPHAASQIAQILIEYLTKE